MNKKLTVLFLCSVIAGTGLGLRNQSLKTVPPKSVPQKEAAQKAEPTPLSFLTDEDLMRESS